MSIKLLALDLDGTIFHDDLTVSDRTRKAITAAQEAGVIVAIATGRMYRSALAIAADLNINGPMICYQGAMIKDVVTGETLLHTTVPRSLMHEIISATSKAGLHLNIYLNDELFVEKITPEGQFYAQINLDLKLNVVGDLSNWLNSLGTAEATKAVIVTDPSQTDAVLEEYSALFGTRLQVTKSHPKFTEFTNIDSSKGKALAQLAAHYNMEQADVMAIGDGLNDLDMIEWAGWGVAMENSPQSVRDTARVVCLTISQDGAADAIERYILAPLTAR
ncbi:MAG: Cof-type HAD-IIB family hydrolase [Chloroflexia bacterium]